MTSIFPFLHGSLMVFFAFVYAVDVHCQCVVRGSKKRVVRGRMTTVERSRINSDIEKKNKKESRLSLWWRVLNLFPTLPCASFAWQCSLRCGFIASCPKRGIQAWARALWMTFSVLVCCMDLDAALPPPAPSQLFVFFFCPSVCCGGLLLHGCSLDACAYLLYGILPPSLPSLPFSFTSVAVFLTCAGMGLARARTCARAHAHEFGSETKGLFLYYSVTQWWPLEFLPFFFFS